MDIDNYLRSLSNDEKVKVLEEIGQKINLNEFNIIRKNNIHII